MMYVLTSQMKEILFNLLDLIKPEYEETEKIEALRRGWEALRLHDLPLFFGLFVFETALKDIKAGIKLKEVALERKHWFPIILTRLELIGSNDLEKIMRFIEPLEKQSHQKEAKNGENTQNNERGQVKSIIGRQGSRSYR